MRNKYIPIILALLFCLTLIISLSGCFSASSTTIVTANTATTTRTNTKTTAITPASVQPVTLNIAAAASLTDALKELNSLYMKSNLNVTLISNFASSGTLQKQIEQGASADLFISAAAAQMDTLGNENLILSSTRKNILVNKIVLVVPADSNLGLIDYKDLASDRVTKIAIGDPKSVPAGTYVQAAFNLLSITAQVTSKYVMGADVKAVLSYVESGKVDAGIVYYTDALISNKVKVAASAPAEINAKIVYPVALVAATTVPEAAISYENYLFSAEAKAVFEKYGFTLPAQ